MNFDKSISNTFGIKKTPPNGTSSRDSHNLAHLGYPSLWQESFFLSIGGVKLWKEKQHILFPNTCCYCENEKTTLLPYNEQSGGLFSKNITTVIDNIPHCDLHAREKRAKLIVSVAKWNEAVIQLSLVGVNSQFLVQTVKLNTQGDVVPPWMAFPDYNTVTSGWRQGEGEYWWNNAWRPFWDRLQPSEKQQYLTNHQASVEWKEFLNTTY